MSNGRALFLLYPVQTDYGVQPILRPMSTIAPARKQHDHEADWHQS
jgi:hypothetical protein